MLGSCVTEAAQDVATLHRPLSSTSTHLRGPQHQAQQHVNNQHLSHHHQPYSSNGYMHASAPSSGAASMPLPQHHAAQTPHHARGHSSSASSFLDAHSGPYLDSSSAPPLLPLPLSLRHQANGPDGMDATNEASNSGFLQQLLHGGMPTDEELEHVSVGGASMSLMAATYHAPQQHHQQQQQQHHGGGSMQLGYPTSGHAHHPHSHAPTPASTGTPTTSSEDLPCIFDELDMFQENPNSIVATNCFGHPTANVPPHHHHAGAMEPGSGAGSLQLLSVVSPPPPLPIATAMTEQLRAREGGRRRKIDDLYPSNGETTEGLVGRRCSHPLVQQPMKRPRTTRRLSTSSSSSSSSSSAAAVKPEPEEAVPPASSSSPAPASSSSSYDSKTVELDDIYVGVRDQVVYWGNSKNKYDVTVCVRAPTRFGAMLKGATISYQVSLPAVQEFKMKSRANAKGKGKPKAERDVKKAVLQLVRTESDNGVVELEAFLKNCLPTEKLSNLTLLELHFSITPKTTAGKSSSHDMKGAVHVTPPSRGGRKRSVGGGDDDDFEVDEEEDGRESLNDDEDEYTPARGGRGRGTRGKTGHRGRGKAGHSHHQRDEERESDDGQGMEYSGMQHSTGGDIPQMQMAPYVDGGVAPIERKVPVVTYTHSKAITRALCRLIWYPMNEENTMSTDFLLEKLCKYFASQVQLPISIYDRHNLAAMLSPFTDGISYVEFYSLLGEWFVLAIKMAKKKTQCLWQQGRETFIPLLFNPYRRLAESSSSSSSSPSSSSSSSTSGGAGDDDEWTEDNDESSSSSRRNGRGRGRRSRSGSRAGLHQSAAAAAAAGAVSGKGKEPEATLHGAADVISSAAQLQLDGILEHEGDFLVTIGPDLKERHGRAEGEEGRGVNYFPSLKYPLQIVYVKEGGEKQCLSVENKLDKLTDFIHAKQCLRDYLVLQRDGTWKRVEKDKFAFNHVQQRRLEETLGRTSVLAREDADSLSYAHA